MAHLDLRFSVGVGRAALWNAMQSESRFDDLTDCVLCERSLIIGAALTGAPEPTGLNGISGVLLLQSDADTATSILIPGFRADLLEQTGCWAQQRVDMLHPDMIAFCDAMAAIPLVTPRGDPIVACAGGTSTHFWFPLNQRSG